jgi:type IV secretory pathway component VirB8
MVTLSLKRATGRATPVKQPVQQEQADTPEQSPRGPRAESYESVRVSRNRAYLLALAAWPIAGLSLLYSVVEKANQSYVPPVVLTLDEKGHVAKSEIGTPAVLNGKDAVIEQELARYVTERYTLNRAFRDDHIRYVVLHSSSQVAAQFMHEMDAKNKDNPYYSIPDSALRRVKDIRIRILDRDSQKAEVTFTTFVANAVEPRTAYWHLVTRYDFVKQALAPEDRYINGTGFIVLANDENNEPGPPSPAPGQ